MYNYSYKTDMNHASITTEFPNVTLSKKYFLKFQNFAKKSLNKNPSNLQPTELKTSNQ